MPSTSATGQEGVNEDISYVTPAGNLQAQNDFSCHAVVYQGSLALTLGSVNPSPNYSPYHETDPTYHLQRVKVILVILE